MCDNISSMSHFSIPNTSIFTVSVTSVQFTVETCQPYIPDYIYHVYLVC